jgi:hypothetical protein
MTGTFAARWADNREFGNSVRAANVDQSDRHVADGNRLFFRPNQGTQEQPGNSKEQMAIKARRE